MRPYASLRSPVARVDVEAHRTNAYRQAAGSGGGGTRPSDPAWPALDISTETAADGTRYRARLALGRRRSADPARVARTFTELMVRLTETSIEVEQSRAATTTDEAGNAVVELRTPVVGIPAALVSGLMEPILEAHAADRLRRARTLAPDVGLTVLVDISVTRSDAGGTLLRVVLHREPGTEPEAPRRFPSGVRLRLQGARDPQATLALGAQR